MSDIYLAISETPTVVTLTSAVINSAVASSVTVTNTVTVALDANSLSALENVTVTVGAAITGTVTVGNSVTISSLPAISGTVTVSNLPLVSSFEAGRVQAVPVYLSGCADGSNIDDINRVLSIPSIPAGTNRIGVVTIGAGTVTIGAGTAQIGSVTASLAYSQTATTISSTAVTAIPVVLPTSGAWGGTLQGYNGTNTYIYSGIQAIGNTSLASATSLPVSLTTLPALVAGTAQIGSVTASISNSVTIASLPAISGTVTANLSISATAITSGSFASLTSATLVPANTSRKMATVYNLGAGQLFVNAGATATTLGGGFMVALSSGDFYECDYTTTTLSAIFATAGTASWVSH